MGRTIHCNAQKVQKNSKILASMAKLGADSLKFWNVLSITVFRAFQGLEKLIVLEHYSVSWLEPHKLEYASVSWPQPHKTL